MSKPEMPDINDLLDYAFPPKAQARILYLDFVLRCGAWVAVANNQAAAEDFVNKEMEEYDKAHSGQS